MLKNIADMFENRNDMLKKLKKKNYETNTIQFRNKYGHYFQEMFEYMESSEDKTAAAEKVGEILADEVKETYSNKKGKIDSRTQADLNFFMIYYVFPTVLAMEKEDAKTLADGIRDVWARSFKDSDIQYTDYDSLYNGFSEKIFGIF